ncbi:MAG: hypothetical protein HY043_03140 [Verrucomicrobia bacterium]|nr:hypothetical protein [Verrucomicrobiota bacterium]
MAHAPLDLAKLKVYPLATRNSLSRIEEILVPPDDTPPACDEANERLISQCAWNISSARKRSAAVILMYGAHLLRNGAALILEKMMARGWVTHLATNGAGTIHDWEYSFLGRSTESVEENVAAGTFGTWDETGRNIHLALLAGALAFKHVIPLTVHPGIGYDIIANHPMFNGAAIGRAADLDFRQFAGTVEELDGGVVLAVGSAIMAPQVFEKSLSCVNNLRLQAGREIVCGHSIYVVDLQDGGNWDWRQGEPPKTNPAYYLRFCKSFSRMGGEMNYLQCDNLNFVHHLLHELARI